MSLCRAEFELPHMFPRTSLVAQMVKNRPEIWETWVPSLGWEDPLEKGMAFSSAGYPVHDNIPVQTISVFLMFLFVGLFEEMAFRAVINDAVIYEFRDKKYVFVLSALMSSLAFGVAHIIGADLSGPLAIVQAVGKIVQTAVFGLAILFLYWKTRNIWACGIIHGIYDFLLSLCDCFFDVPGKKISYVVSGEAGKYTVIIYAVITAIELFIFWMIYRKIGKKIDYRKIREEW